MRRVGVISAIYDLVKRVLIAGSDVCGVYDRRVVDIIYGQVEVTSIIATPAIGYSDRDPVHPYLGIVRRSGKDPGGGPDAQEGGVGCDRPGDGVPGLVDVRGLILDRIRHILSGSKDIGGGFCNDRGIVHIDHVYCVVQVYVPALDGNIRPACPDVGVLRCPIQFARARIEGQPFGIGGHGPLHISALCIEIVVVVIELVHRQGGKTRVYVHVHEQSLSVDIGISGPLIVPYHYRPTLAIVDDLRQCLLEGRVAYCGAVPVPKELTSIGDMLSVDVGGRCRAA